MSRDDVKTDAKWAIALLILSLMGFSAALTSLHAPPANDWWTSYEDLPSEGTENLTGITGQLLSTDQNTTFTGGDNVERAGMPLVIPFEVLGLLLTVALIGALTLAIRDPEEGEPEHGQVPPPARVETGPGTNGHGGER